VIDRQVETSMVRRKQAVQPGIVKHTYLIMPETEGPRANPLPYGCAT